MADDDTRVTGKTIKLNKLKPNEYRLWVVQVEATFEVYKCLNIVLGKEPKPKPDDTLSQSQSQHLSMTKTQHLSFHGILAMRLHEKHCSGHLSLPTLSKSSLSRTVRLLSGNVLKTNTANRPTLNTYESIRNFKPYLKTRRPP